MTSILTFEAWKELLRKDCLALDKEREFGALGDPVLKLLYDCGVDPTVKAIVNDNRKLKVPA